MHDRDAVPGGTLTTRAIFTKLGRVNAVDVSPLYHPTLLRHARQPRLRGPLAGPHTSHAGHNRSCGDRVTLHVAIADERLSMRFEGEGCQLSLGSASAMCEALEGQTRAAGGAIAQAFLAALEGRDHAELAGDLGVFLAVRAFPARLGCVRLAADTFITNIETLAPSEGDSSP